MSFCSILLLALLVLFSNSLEVKSQNEVANELITLTSNLNGTDNTTNANGQVFFNSNSTTQSNVGQEMVAASRMEAPLEMAVSKLRSESGLIYRMADELLVNTFPKAPPPPPIFLAAEVDNDDTNCKTFDKIPGNCMELKSCDSLNNLLMNDTLLHEHKIIRQSICGYSVTGILFCCPKNKTELARWTTTSRITARFASSITRVRPEEIVEPQNETDFQYKLLTVPKTQISCGISSNYSQMRIIGGKKSVRVSSIRRKKRQREMLMVVGGKISPRGAWPWLAALGYRNLMTGTIKFSCGGTLVSSKFLVTAAHCVYQTRDELAFVRLREHDLFSEADGANPIDFKVAEIILHPNYNSKTYQNDIALLRLAQEVNFTKNIRPICLPYTKQLQNSIFTGSPVVAGWGATGYGGVTSEVLREVRVPIVPNEECRQKYSTIRNTKVDEKNICAGWQIGGKDACQGDSGGPLMFLVTGKIWVIIGVVSHGFRCAEKGFPGIYTRVSSHVNWVLDTMSKKS